MLLGPIKLALKVVGLLISSVVVYFAFGFVQIWLAGHQHSHRVSDAIVVFGTRQDNCVPSPTLAGRLDEVVRLYELHLAPRVVVTGGRQPGDSCTEAQASRYYLVARGIPRSVILEGGGNDTWENIASSLPLITQNNIHSVLIVSDPFHVYRAGRIAAALGLDPAPSATTSTFVVGRASVSYYFGETLRVGMGRILGYQRMSEWLGGIKKVSSVTP